MTIAKCCLAVLLLAGVWVCSGCSSSNREGAAKPVAVDLTRIDLPSFGLAAPIPDGFARDADGDTVFMLAPIDEVGRRGDRVIMCLSQPLSEGESFEQRVKKVSLVEGLEIQNDPIDWGGRVATDLRRPTRKLGRGVVRQAILERDGRVYRLAYVADAGQAGEQEPFERVLRETTWVPIVAPAMALANRRPRLVLSNSLAVAIPDPFRPVPSQDTEYVIRFEAKDLTTNETVAELLVVPYPPRDTPSSLNAAKERIEKDLASRLGVKALAWEDPRKGGRGARSLPAEGRDGTVQIYIHLQRGSVTAFCLLTRSGEKSAGEMVRVFDLIQISIATIKGIL